MRRVKITPVLCVMAALVAIALWPLSYDLVRVATVSLGKYRIVATSFNGNLNLSSRISPKHSSNDQFNIRFSSNGINLVEAGSDSAKVYIIQGTPSKIRRPFGKPHFQIFETHVLSRFTFQTPHWIVAFIFILIGTLWQIFGKRPDDAVESD